MEQCHPIDWFRLFSFKLDGVYDRCSINPLEMTNYERFGWLTAAVVVAVALAWEWWKRRRISGLDRDAEIIYVAAPLSEHESRRDSK